MKLLRVVGRSATGEIPAYFPGWLEAKYGTHFAQISVDTKLKLKSAVKDVSRAMRKRCEKCGAQYETPDHVNKCDCGGERVVGYVSDDIEGLCKTFFMPPQGVEDIDFVQGYVSDEGWIPGSSESGHNGTDLNLLTYIERYPQDWDVVKKCLGLTRQKSKHPCGYVIANKPIPDFIPLVTVTDSQVTGFTAAGVEAVGGIKMDFLGVNSLKDIQDAIVLIQQRSQKFETRNLRGGRTAGYLIVRDPKTSEPVSIWDLPEDPDVFDDICSGRTETVFQFNTPSATQWLANFNYVDELGQKGLKSILDLAAFTALDRPGPLDFEVSNPDYVGPPGAPGSTHNMLVEFSRRARGAKPSPDILSVMEELVPETYGVMCYQESLQRVYQNLTDCSGAEAEEFRGDIAKKRKSKVDAAYLKFIERASLKLGTEKAQMVWDSLKTFAAYGFNLSHAVCYSIIGYASAWLKHHYPLEWWCSVLKNATKNDVNDKFWRHCGHLVLLPDVQKSGSNWQIEGDKLRAPISLLHGVGEKAHEQLVQYAPYRDLAEFCGSQIEHRAKNQEIKTKELKNKDGTTSEVEVLSLGRSVIRRKTVYDLIVAGTLSSFFEAGTSIAGCLDAYDAAIVAACNEKYVAATGEEKKKWKSALAAYNKASKTNYKTLDALGRYQTIKGVLPAYGEDIRELVKSTELPPYLVMHDGRMKYLWKKWSREHHREVSVADFVVDTTKLKLLNENRTNFPPGGYRCAALCYIDEIKKFRWGENKSKEALELTVEVGGDKYRFAHFCRDGIVAGKALELETGAILASVLVRSRVDKPFIIQDFEVIRKKETNASEE